MAVLVVGISLDTIGLVLLGAGPLRSVLIGVGVILAIIACVRVVTIARRAANESRPS
jgi:hypothetical protein